MVDITCDVVRDHPVVTLDWQLAACGEGGRSEALPRKGSPTVKGSPSRPGREPTGGDEGAGEDTAEDGERAVTPPTPRCRSSIPTSTLATISSDDHPLPSLSTAIIRDDSIITRIV